MLTNTREMSVSVSLFLDKIKRDFAILEINWNPTVLQEEPVCIFQLTFGVLWSPIAGLHVIQSLVTERVWKYFEKHFEGVSLIQMEDEHAILGERFPHLQKLPR